MLNRVSLSVMSFHYLLLTIIFITINVLYLNAID
jgi:hypothetical protein